MDKFDEIDAIYRTLRTQADAAKKHPQYNSPPSSLPQDLHNVAEDFCLGAEPSINEAIKNQYISRTWEPPPKFEELLSAWLAAHARLASHHFSDAESIGRIMAECVASKDSLLKSIYDARKPQRKD